MPATTPKPQPDMDQLCVNTIRTLAMEEIRLAKRHYGWPEDDKFVVPDGVQAHFRAGFGQRGQGLREAWRLIAQFRHEPVALVLSRQSLPTLDRTTYASAEGVQRGAYVLADADHGQPEVLLLSTGSEVALCVEAYEQLKTEGIKARVVSMPSWEIFEYYCSKHPEYRDTVLPEAVTARVSVEQASTLGWAQYVGRTGCSIGMQTFGASAPLKELQQKFGFTSEHIVGAAKDQLALVN
jgi:transketolase